eukprot:Protomagalhaensia_sp_Gyna_25__5376@NODE_690_length_2833_cov_110_076235_g539_i0_p3_GENE_NODE_690_length_2833_cov_110_076235_g539_i0NODE_690_length_2833_cov_110_076235_g539_i0_p3_ORF_typecomplete_len114_score2_37TNFR_c6/PF00020_18/0_044_NODE_690_length_2833_cov_110_076235_g539_i0316657
MYKKTPFLEITAIVPRLSKLWRLAGANLKANRLARHSCWNGYYKSHDNSYSYKSRLQCKSCRSCKWTAEGRYLEFERAEILQRESREEKITCLGGGSDVGMSVVELQKGRERS